MQSGPKRIYEKMQDPAFVASLPKTRAEALEKGSTMYLGAACKNGHLSYRNTANGVCAQCASNWGSMNKAPSSQEKNRKRTNARWNSSEGAKTAKDRWKAKDPKWAWVVSAVTGARARAKYRELPFDIDNEYVMSIAPDCCPALGMPLVFGGHGRALPNSASLDKKDPTRGYVRGNVAVISLKANAIKSDASPEEVAQVAAWMRGEVVR